MKSPALSTQWEIDGQERTVRFRCYPGHPGTWYRRNGDPGDPPEPPELEIEAIDGMTDEEFNFHAYRLADDDYFNEVAWKEYEARTGPVEIDE